jgi:hypothetical protein
VFFERHADAFWFVAGDEGYLSSTPRSAPVGFEGFASKILGSGRHDARQRAARLPAPAPLVPRPFLERPTDPVARAARRLDVRVATATLDASPRRRRGIAAAAAATRRPSPRDRRLSRRPVERRAARLS